jgi:hypothetical protein
MPGHYGPRDVGSSIPLHERRDASDCSCNPPCLILVEALCGHLPLWFVLEVEERQFLAATVNDHEALGVFFDLPRWRKAAWVGH